MSEKNRSPSVATHKNSNLKMHRIAILDFFVQCVNDPFNGCSMKNKIFVVSKILLVPKINFHCCIWHMGHLHVKQKQSDSVVRCNFKY